MTVIADKDGKYGVRGICVHPNVEDKDRLGDTVQNGAQDDMAMRTRGWIQSLGPILPPDEAKTLADKLLADKRALYAAATAARVTALEARVDEVDVAAAGPSSVTNNVTNNVTNIHLYEGTERKRALGSLDGYFKRLRE